MTPTLADLVGKTVASIEESQECAIDWLIFRFTDGSVLKVKDHSYYGELKTEILLVPTEPQP